MKSKEQEAKERRDMTKAAAMVLQVSLSAICPILLLLSVGIWLDGKYGNGGYWFTAFGIICGVYSAYKGSYQLIKDVWLKKEEENEVYSESDKQL
ncbi:MAG: AtpZ/AtpI family protein [Oscillospiraceae bacterium]|nr:AtpZ/AtpI family protein [Oscillospiraceae bacterium]MBQ2861769.1 AtpZ/AtpI family protein [Oscillospiraceae bacterium]MBQ2998182.1 AtpZ/AtpI family protein [Oscillospiraceae bacterium]MBQ3236296.1 AtpZ/AtpI family protein [Oscillospiraceae bacterium]MBQ3561085.1 AtpZ/AtpI family protein [Oscillospiraceae bacterium]